jgi:hypothetical protein
MPVIDLKCAFIVVMCGPVIILEFTSYRAEFAAINLSAIEACEEYDPADRCVKGSWMNNKLAREAQT